MTRVLVDTSVLIEAERDGGVLDALIADDDEPAIAAITLAELGVGVDLARGAVRKRRAQFLETAARHIADPLAVEPNPRVTGPSYHPLWKQISGQWVILNGDPDSVAVCLETSWNTPHSTVDGYRAVGRQLGLTVADWLANDKR